MRAYKLRVRWHDFVFGGMKGITFIQKGKHIIVRIYPKDEVDITSSTLTQGLNTKSGGCEGRNSTNPTSRNSKCSVTFRTDLVLLNKVKYKCHLRFNLFL